MRISMYDSTVLILKEIGRRVQEYRIKMKMTQKELSEMSGVSLRTISNIETGSNSSMDNIIRILKALNLEDSINSIVPDTSEIVTVIKFGERKRYKAPKKKSDWKWGDE